MMHRLLAVSLLCSMLLFAAPATEQNGTVAVTHTVQENNQSVTTLQRKSGDAQAKARQLKALIEKKQALDKKLLDNNIWSKIYSNYHTYMELRKQKEHLDDQMAILDNKYKRTKEEEKAFEMLKSKRSIIEGKLQLLKEYESDPFKKFLKPPEITDVPTVGNPLAIISALSYIKKLKTDETEYESRYESIKKVMEKLEERKLLLKKILLYDANNTKYKEELLDTEEKIKTFTPVVEIFKTTQNVYTKKIDELTLNLRADIKREMEKASNIGMIILFFILFILLIKYLVRRYMSDNDRFYTINKALNFTFVTLMLLTLLFAYIENVNYIVTILGFASAGIAIAMKDWFMSIMGWFVIIIGGAIHVGDRVKFVREGVEYVGDVVDISLLRMTIQEDITLTTYMHNRRAGRIIFVPNNFIFTDMVANYSHAGLKTVWDGIDFMITFDSNVTKASSIAKEVTKKYAKGYTEITRKQLNKLRSQYSMKNTNVEPRIYTFIEPYGIKISAWYHTNAYATLTLRSTISMEIIERLQAENDIFLAFPTQSIYVDKDVRKPLPPEEIQYDEDTLA
ncbi:mechanosensitive ion channel family protein [Sulfurovum sp. NBC37-1]|uniref:mechanosensitive ion channel family protein n=1 Tax=Sulfurovum sp. (strain NBC37-1) TaxID=387093 RepID=UPI00015877D9|nr:mechanosensitive ion channel domain-containing protein [Sulfurovum sp. NBC37-1]BAF71968.1 mechanosensitive ion channel [Sulfurovum sp. NBC37-1]